MNPNDNPNNDRQNQPDEQNEQSEQAELQHQRVVTKRHLFISGLFLYFVFFGGIWLSVARFLPEGRPRSIGIVALGGLFVGLFVWQLISRVRHILAGVKRLPLHLVMLVLDIALLLVAFAIVYQKLGIQDNTVAKNPVTHDFWKCLYYSVVTFTTLGYGDFYPLGLGRVLAAMEAMVGYIILGLIVSSSVNILSPNQKPQERDNSASANSSNGDGSQSRVQTAARE